MQTEVEVSSSNPEKEKKINFLGSTYLTYLILGEMVNFPKSQLCGKIRFLPYGLWHVGLKVIGTNLCANINRRCHSHSSKLVLKVKRQDDVHLVAGCVMEGSMVFCQKNILEHSMRFHGDYLKRCLLTHRVSPIL